MSPDGTFALVTNLGGVPVLSRVDVPSGNTTVLVTSGLKGPWAVAIDPTTTYALIGDVNFVKRVSLATGALSTIVFSGLFGNIRGISIDPTGWCNVDRSYHL